MPNQRLERPVMPESNALRYLALMARDRHMRPAAQARR